MTDEELIGLYFSRSEEAIAQTKAKYGSYLSKTAGNILRSSRDTEECLNDAYLAAWNTIPPKEPENLQTYLGKLTRNAAIDRARRLSAEKRGGGHFEAVLEELSEAAASESSLDGIEDMLVLKETFNGFLRSLNTEQRSIFLRRYWYMERVTEIADALGINVNKVKVTLFRTRNKLKKLLEREGFDI